MNLKLLIQVSLGTESFFQAMVDSESEPIHPLCHSQVNIEKVVLVGTCWIHCASIAKSLCVLRQKALVLSNLEYSNTDVCIYLNYLKGIITSQTLAPEYT